MPDNELVERYVEHRKVTRALNTYKNACSVSRALLPTVLDDTSNSNCLGPEASSNWQQNTAIRQQFLLLNEALRQQSATLTRKLLARRRNGKNL